jgi:hypothetical protein
MIRPGRNHDQALDPPAQQIGDQHALLLAVLCGVGHDEGMSVLADCLLHAIRERGHVRIRHVAHDEAGELHLLTEALTIVDRTQERWFEAELHRLRAEALLASSPSDSAEAEASLRHALAVARDQEARFWELRAATSLARLWRDHDKRIEARDLLAPIYGSFTEGFDTRDLKEAAALVAELAK